MTDSKASR